MEGFESFVSSVRERVDRSARAWLDVRCAEARAQGPEVLAAADAVRELVLRGGKRLRPVLLAAAFEACSSREGEAAVTQAGVAIEILQGYLLVHDDWMDGDDVRRGGPSVPAILRARYADRRWEHLSVLAGDLACAWSFRALLEAQADPASVLRASGEFSRMAEDVVRGQLLDIGASSRDLAEVEAVHALKTASYTVRGPVAMGAALAGAPESLVAGLVEFAVPLGIAFQLRDDLLGAFGDPRTTGKPAGGDVRSGKRSAVVVEALRDPRTAAVLERVLGRADASPAEVAAAIEHLASRGVRARIESRIAERAAEARAALGRLDLTPSGRALLAAAVEALTERDA